MTDKAKLEKIKKLADAMYYAAFNITTNASLLIKAMDEYHQFIINEYHKEEQIIKELREKPVSEQNLSNVERIGKECKEEPVSEEFKEFEVEYIEREKDNIVCVYDRHAGLVDGANWQKEQDQSTIELAEDHAYFAGKTKTIDEIKEALLSEVLPCFMHGGEADEVVAKLDEVLNQKK